LGVLWGWIGILAFFSQGMAVLLLIVLVTPWSYSGGIKGTFFYGAIGKDTESSLGVVCFAITT
jgi:hypothetical protein